MANSPKSALSSGEAAYDALLDALRSGIFKPGDRLPDFTLPDVDGAQVSSAELLAGGPLVISFYRGAW